MPEVLVSLSSNHRKQVISNQAEKQTQPEDDADDQGRR